MKYISLDVVGQLVLMLLTLAFFVEDKDDINSYWVYLGLGIFQFLSACLNRFLFQRRITIDKIYIVVMLVLGMFMLLYWLGQDLLPQWVFLLGYIYLIVMIFYGPFLALYYFVVTILEIRKSKKQ